MNTAQSYNRVADEYVRRIFDELQHKPFDRQLLDRFAEKVRRSGTVCDIGCGPGQVARYLAEKGCAVQGIDLSPVMIQRAQALNPEIEFFVGDMTNLSVAEAMWAGITAFYSIIHISCEDLPTALQELFRVLQPRGVLLMAFHLGENTIHLNEWWGQKVDVDFHFFKIEEMTTYLAECGFEIEETIEREPYPEIEHQSRRAYVLASRP